MIAPAFFWLALIGQAGAGTTFPPFPDAGLGSTKAFFCQMDSGTQVSGPAAFTRDLNILFEQSSNESSMSRLVETYDPTSLLGFAKFDEVSISTPSGSGYTFRAKGLGGKASYFLVLAPKPGEPGKYAALLGTPDESIIPAGYCRGPVAMATKSDFMEQSARGGE